MAEYRDLTKILTLAKDLVYRMPSTFYNGIQSLLQEIINLPAADVVPVIHGRWDDFKPDMPVRRKKCSSCGYIANPWLAQVFNFCPICGAKMDGGKEE